MHLNKIGLLALSMSAVFMASSCNKADTKVTEEEFNKALSLDGVDYLQANFNSNIESSIGGQTFEEKTTAKQQMSPEVYYIVGTYNDPKSENYKESYATKKDKEVTYIFRENKGDDFKEGKISWDDDKRPQFFLTPQEYALTIKALVGELKFDDFKYKNEAYVYEFKSEIMGSGKYSFSFSNKKLSKVAIDMNLQIEGMIQETKTVFNLTYSKIVPSKPKK